MSVIKKMFSQKTNKYVSGTTLLGVAVLLFVFLPNSALAQTLLPITVTQSTTTPSSFNLKLVDTSFSLAGSVSRRDVVLTTDYDSSSPNSVRCYPRASGSGGFASNYSISYSTTTYFTSNTSGGSPACNVSGVYQTVYKTAGGDKYYIQYNYDVTTGQVSANNFIQSTSTRIYSIDSPTNNQAFPDTNSIDFQYKVFFGSDKPDHIITGIELQSFTSGISYAPEEDDIISTGLSTFNFNYTVGLDYGLYSWRPYIRSATSSDKIYGDTRLFTVGDVSEVSSLFPAPSSTSTEWTLDCEGGNIVTNSICTVVGYLFVPSTASLDGFRNMNETLKTKAPFAYVYDFKDSINTLYTTSQTATSSITVPFSTFGDITLISSAQLSAVPYSSTIRTLLGYIMWFMFFTMIYRRSLTIFNKTPV